MSSKPPPKGTLVERPKLGQNPVRVEKRAELLERPTVVAHLHAPDLCRQPVRRSVAQRQPRGRGTYFHSRSSITSAGGTRSLARWREGST